MTIDHTRDPHGRLPVADEDGPFCAATHWLGYACEADPGHDGRHRHYEDGSRFEWTGDGEDWSPIVLKLGDER